MINSKINNNELIRSIKKLFSWISFRRKKNIFYLISLSVFIALLELLTILSIGPMINSLDPENGFSIGIFEKLEFLNKTNFLFILGIGFVLLVSITSYIKIRTIAYGHYLAAVIGHEVGDNLLKNFLGQTYEERINHSSSEVINTFSIHLTLATKLLNFVLQLFVSFFTSLFLLLFIIYKNPIITFGTFFSIVIAYLIVGRKYKNVIIKDSKISKIALDDITSQIQELLNNTEKSILSYKDKFYLNRFRNSDIIQRMAGKRIRNYGTLPRYIIECVGLISFSLLTIIYSYLSGDDIKQIFSLLATILYGIQKLLPSINQIYNSWANMNVCVPSIYSIDKLLKENFDKKRLEDSEKKKVEFKNKIELKGIDFKYRNTTKYIFSNKSIIINKGDKILLRGKSGSGKSTLIQIISTLINPLRGEIKIDNSIVGVDISKSSWRRQISYVKQKPKLYGEKLIDFILGEQNEIENKSKLIKKAQKVAKIACIDDFIESMPNKYYEKIKEDEGFLSGGQIQRFAIANALSYNPIFLILDESTAGIDKETEKKIIKNLINLPKLTLLFISHSKNIENEFDKIIYL